MVSFSHLVRFKDSNGDIHYGEAPSGVVSAKDLIDKKMKTYISNPLEAEGTVLFSEDERTIAEVLSPIPETPLIYGVGTNYRKHAEEGNQPIPPYPVIFTKPPDALAGPYEEIPVSKELQFMDYEGELTVVIGKDVKDLPESANPLDYVLGYTVGNDVSSRYWQMPERSGHQHGYAKSFDKFAPIGPVLVSAKEIPDPSLLSMTTRVNGEQRQSTRTDDLIFDVPTIIRHLSRGTTLRKYTVIMTGTPSGVAAFMKPPAWLKDGDVVEIEISNIGLISNRMKFTS